MSEGSGETSKCPKHLSTCVTPTDSCCHGHISDEQQRWHNRHCKLLGCKRALKGTERHENVPIHPPRNLVERILKFIG
ncbi:hypothetical protein CL635_02650 [bacterium]|jgi:hypothetical protein|nr:hypothetical protein [bacterium]